MKSLILALLLFYCMSLHGQQKSYTFVFLHKKPDAEKLSKEQGEEIMKGHLANIERLAKENKILVAGPFEGGGGIFILNTSSTDSAKAWLGTDPGIRAKRWDIEILPYTPRQRTVCVAKEPYEMVTYEFIRFTPIVSKFTAQTYPEILKRHEDYLKALAATGNVVADGTFGDRDGGILLMRGDLQKEVIEGDPGVEEGLLELTYKKLWVAKGSFCEP